MSRLAHKALLVILACLATASAADIEGTVAIKRKLTRRNVTATSSAYQRGVSVELGAADAENALDFERTHVAVYLEDRQPSLPPAVTPVMEQIGRQFVPDLVIVPVGSSVSFPNRDLIFHNVFSLSKPKTFDLGNYTKDQTRIVTFSQPGVVLVNCHLHPNMGAVIVVTPNQWAVKPRSDGTFKLTGVPPGRHSLAAWHKSVGVVRQSVDIVEGQIVTVKFLLPFEEKSPVTMGQLIVSEQR
jgi:plastocyanin